MAFERERGRKMTNPSEGEKPKIKIHFGPDVFSHIDPDGSVTAELFSATGSGARYDNGVILPLNVDADPTGADE